MLQKDREEIRSSLCSVWEAGYGIWTENRGGFGAGHKEQHDRDQRRESTWGHGNKGLRQSREALEATWPWAEAQAGGAGGRLAQVPDTRLKGLNVGPVLHKARKWY